jgi:uncharacterized membrane protein YwzB
LLAVDREDLIPPVPVLTRYKKELGIKAFVKKEIHEVRTVDERKASEIIQLTMPKLCVRLNSLYYGISQLSKLEDSINERWARRKSESINIRRSMSEKSKSAVSSQKNQFDGSRKEINAAIDRICEFTGLKVIFWDLQQPFIDNLYKNNVSQARLDAIMEVLDTVLNQLCNVIVEQLRDRVVTGLLQASLVIFPDNKFCRIVVTACELYVILKLPCLAGWPTPCDIGWRSYACLLSK